MPELPEVEVVRRGLDDHVVGSVLHRVEVLHPRAARRHELGSLDLEARLAGTEVRAVDRRGKYLWLVVAPPGGDLARAEAIVVHLGMSGQMLVQPTSAPAEKHLRIRVDLGDDRELRFVDQRTFGGWAVADLVDSGGTLVPAPVAHIARDPLDPLFDVEQVVATMRGKHTEIKRALLDQTVVSGVGNIYADESLWRSKIHGARLTDSLTRPALRRVLHHAHAVMGEALAQG